MAAIANSVEWLVRKPYCCGLNTKWLVTKEYNLLQINFSKTLQRVGSIDIGLYSLRDLGKLILSIGEIWAIFKRLGNSPFAIHLLKNPDNQDDKLPAEIFKNFSGMS